MSDLLTTFALIVALIFVYHYRSRILEALRRVDRANRARIEEQARDRQDPVAHFRHTLSLAEEQVETVSQISVSDPRTAETVKRYLFEGEQFLDRADAERVRAEKVREIARRFYRELPRALAARKDDRLN